MVPDIISIPPAVKQHKDRVTSHKIALSVAIKEFCYAKIKMKDVKPFQAADTDSWIHTNKQNRDMAISLLKLMQSPDIPLKELNNIMASILHPRTNQEYLNSLKKLRKSGIADFMDYVQALEPLLVDPTPSSPVVHKSSVIGLFIRRLLLAFDKLSFSQVTRLCHRYFRYYDSAFGTSSTTVYQPPFSHMTGTEKLFDESDSDTEGETLASQKQAEFFIAQQASLLTINENEAMPPLELQTKIRDLLKGNPALSEAHYLSFLNSLRVKEYCGAVQNLCHHFDRNTTVPHDSKTPPASEDVNRTFRYAALNLAILHARFGHKEQALAALKEAIMVAQDVNDNISLQHALAWLYRLDSENAEILVERSISKASELNLWYLSSLGIQSLAKLRSLTTATPIAVFDFVMKGDILNCQHYMTEVMGTAYALRAALWSHYGNSCMAVLISELLLNLNTADPIRGGIYHIGEGTCIALCNLANAFAAEGENSTSIQMLAFAQQLFPAHSEHSHIWKLCDLVIGFEGALYSGNWVEAEKIIAGIKILDSQMAKFRSAQLFLHQGHLTKAHHLTKELIQECDTTEVSPHFHVRVLLLKASILSQTSNYTLAIPPVLKCFELCKIHHMIHLNALSLLHLSSIQLILNLPNKALQMLDTVFIQILAHGTAYDKGCCYMLYAKAVAASAKEQKSIEEKTEKKLTAASLCGRAVKLFEKTKAVHKTKYCLCWQAHLYDQLGMTAERNASAHQFSTIEQQYPIASWNGVLVP